MSNITFTTASKMTPAEYASYKAWQEYKAREMEKIRAAKEAKTTCEFCGSVVAKDEYTHHILRRHPEEQ